MKAVDEFLLGIRREVLDAGKKKKEGKRISMPPR